MTLAGSCHCGAIRVVFEPGMAVNALPLRACQCGFCTRHGARTTSDASGSLEILAAPGSVSRYRFGRKQVDAILCGECGVYVASMLSADGGCWATLNTAGVGLDAFAGRTAEPSTYDHETDAEKLARRKARWTPTILVEAMVSA